MYDFCFIPPPPNPTTVLKGKVTKADHVDEAWATPKYPVLSREIKEIILEGQDLFSIVKICERYINLTTIRINMHYKKNNLKQLKCHGVSIQYDFDSWLINEPDA